MYVAMNRFRVAPGRAAEFETVWRQRRSYLHEVPGFRAFRLLRGDPTGDATVFVSYSEWESRVAFEAWTEGEAFEKAHRSARTPAGVLLGHPEFEGYDEVRLS